MTDLEKLAREIADYFNWEATEEDIQWVLAALQRAVAEKEAELSKEKTEVWDNYGKYRAQWAKRALDAEAQLAAAKEAIKEACGDMQIGDFTLARITLEEVTKTLSPERTGTPPEQNERNKQ